MLDEHVVVAADAKHAQHEAVEAIRATGAHYALTIKANQPSALAAIRQLPWAQGDGHTTRRKAHGRNETRTVKAVSLDRPHELGWRDVAQVMKIVRTTRRKTTPAAEPQWHTETVYAITSLPAAQAGPAELADIMRGQWVLENKVHHVRDRSMDEDRHAARTGNTAHAWSIVRNTAISILRQNGAANIAAAQRANMRDTDRLLMLIT